MSLSLSPGSGWIATVMFFSVNVGAAIVMFITTLLFTLVTVLMALVLFKVSDTRVNTLSGVTNSQTQTFPLLRCTACTGAVAVACSALRRSGAPGCGRVPRWGKRASTRWLKQPKDQAYPSTLPPYPAIPTTVAGDDKGVPLGGDRQLLSVMHKHTKSNFTPTWQ